MQNVILEQFWFFVAFFFAGLAVNLTPCVYPMLTVTVSLFKNRPSEEQKISYSFFKALAYFLGIAVMYSTLGYFAASTGKIFGAALQSPVVLFAVAILMFALAASMFGLFQLRIPSELLNRLGGLRKANYVGFFLSGLFVGIFAAPCIGPPVLALLAAVAENGDPRFGLSAFFIFSLGLGLPYLILGTFSGLASKLPKAGAWLIWVERVFGVVLVGFGIFYLSLALNLHTPGPRSGINWTPYSIEAQGRSLMVKKPVIIDFYADWCIECHVLEEKVFSDPEVKAKLDQVATLRVDATNFEDPRVQGVTEQYEIIGLPTVLFLNPKGDEIKAARMEGAGSKEEFLKSLEILAKENQFTYQ